MSEALTVAADDRKARWNVVVLAAAGALGGAVPPISFALATLAAFDLLGASKSLATFPITAFVVGTALGTVPAALLMRRVGRRAGFITGSVVGVVGGLVEALAMSERSFALLCLGCALLGFAQAFVQQYRFAAADTASPAFRPRAISLVMAGGVLAGVIGPQTAIYTADMIGSAPFAGAFLASAALSLLCGLVLLALDIPRPAAALRGEGGRPVGVIARQPQFLIAVGCAAASAALMSFVMTAAPLAMVMHHHHRDDAALGIQWHVLAMFGPSFITGSLIARFGAHRVVALGLVLLIGCSLVALAGSSVMHFWVALVLLGVGWNFGFIGGTELVTRTYAPVEKEKVQALNDFIIYGVVALASFSSGEILLYGSWNVVNLVVIPFALACLAAVLWELRRPRAEAPGELAAEQG